VLFLGHDTIPVKDYKDTHDNLGGRSDDCHGVFTVRVNKHGLDTHQNENKCNEYEN